MPDVEGIIARLEQVREGLCGYMGPTCDCKYGFPADTAPGTEQTGCPEIRDAIGFLRQLHKLTTEGQPLLTWQEWDDSQRILRGFTDDSYQAAATQKPDAHHKAHKTPLKPKED